jgi:hypothetical protein
MIKFIKLLLIAITCNLLIVAGLVLIDLNIQYKDYESAMDFIGVLILLNTLNYVYQHEPRQRIKYLTMRVKYITTLMKGNYDQR